MFTNNNRCVAGRQLELCNLPYHVMFFCNMHFFSFNFQSLSNDKLGICAKAKLNMDASQQELFWQHLHIKIALNFRLFTNN